MPRVRGAQPGQVQPNAAPAVYQSASASGESFGGGQARDIQRAGQGLQSLGQGIGNFALVEQDRVNKALVRDSLNSVRTDMRTFMADVYQRKGKDAIGAHAETLKKVDELRKKYGAAFKNPVQRDLFDSNFSDLANDHLDKALVFGEKAKVEYENNSLDAENQNAIEDAVLNRTDRKAVGKAEFTLVANTRYKHRGQDPAFIKERVEEARHLLHKSVMEAIAVDSPVAAKEYFKKYQNHFDPSERTAIKEKLEKESLSFEVRQQALQWSTQGMTLEDQLKEVDKIKDPDRAKLLKAEVEERTKTKDVLKARQLADTEDAHWQSVRNGGQVPFGRVRGEVARDMFAYQQAIVRGFAPSSDRSVLLDLGTKTDAELRDMPTQTLISYSDRLSQEDFDAVFNRHKDLKLGKAADDLEGRFKSVRSDATMINDMLEGVGLTTTGKKDGDRKKAAQLIGQFWEAYDQRAAEAQKKLGRPLDSLEKQDIAERLLVETQKKRKQLSFFGIGVPKKLAFEATIEDLDRGTRRRYQEALEKAGLPVTNETVLELYTRDLQDKAAK